MPCKAGTFNVFPVKSPPLLLQGPPCPLAFSRHGVCQDPASPIPLGSQGTPHPGRKHKEGNWKVLITPYREYKELQTTFSQRHQVLYTKSKWPVAKGPV